jgi:predicted nucleotidyltransferase
MSSKSSSLVDPGSAADTRRRMGYSVQVKDNLEDMIAVINGAVDCVIPDAECVVLFGSWARGDIRPFSDIDLAISLPVNPDLLVLGDLAGTVEAASGRQVDVVLLRDLPERDPELAFKIADEGVLVTQRCTNASSTDIWDGATMSERLQRLDENLVTLEQIRSQSPAGRRVLLTERHPQCMMRLCARLSISMMY